MLWYVDVYIIHYTCMANYATLYYFLGHNIFSVQMLWKGNIRIHTIVLFIGKHDTFIFFSIYSLVVVSLSPHYGKNLFFMIIILQMFVHDYLTVLPLVNFLYLLYSNKLSKHAIFCLRSIPVSYAVFYTHCTVKALTVSIAQHFHTNNKLCCKFKMFYVKDF